MCTPHLLFHNENTVVDVCECKTRVALARASVRGMTLVLLRDVPSDKLLVVFNSYAALAFGDLDKSFSTHLQGYGFFCTMQASVLWIAEARASWYTENDAALLSKISALVAQKGIKTVAMFGMSSGGYAAIRFAHLLSHQPLPSVHTITCVAINPVTGFRPDLLDVVKEGVDECGWDAAPRSVVLECDAFASTLCAPEELDLRVQFSINPATSDRVMHHIFYNEQNSFDRTFADDLVDDRVRKWPFKIGASHHDGCLAIFSWLIEDHRFLTLFAVDVTQRNDIALVAI